MDRGQTGKQFFGLFTPGFPDQQVKKSSHWNLSLHAGYLVEAYAAPVGKKGEFPSDGTLFATSTPSEMESVIDYEYLSGLMMRKYLRECL